MTEAIARWAEAVGVTPAEGGGYRGVVCDGWDVFGIPHGGYQMGIAANAALAASGLPDVMSITTHFARRAVYGPLDLDVRRVSASRRFSSLLITASQGGEVVTTTLALMADRETFRGPRWTTREAPALDDAVLTPPGETPPETPASGTPDSGTTAVGTPAFEGPAVATRLGLRLALEDVGFAHGAPTGKGIVRGLVAPAFHLEEDQRQVLAIIACDLTPPAVWNAEGAVAWVPTVELSAQLRARAADGPLRVIARTTDVGDGFVDEEAEVYDPTGRMVLHSNQHARISRVT